MIIQYKIMETINPLVFENKKLNSVVIIQNDIFATDDLFKKIHQKSDISLKKYNEFLCFYI